MKAFMFSFCDVNKVHRVNLCATGVVMEVCNQCSSLGDGWNLLYNNCVANLVPVLLYW